MEIPSNNGRTFQQSRRKQFLSCVILLLFVCLQECAAIICYQCSTYGLPPPPLQRSPDSQFPVTLHDPSGCYQVNTTTPLIDCPPTAMHCLTAYGIYAGQPVITRGCGTTLNFAEQQQQSSQQLQQSTPPRLQAVLRMLSESGCRMLQLAMSCECNQTQACNGQSFLDLHNRAVVHLALTAPVELEERLVLENLQNEQENQLSRLIIAQRSAAAATTSTTTSSPAATQNNSIQNNTNARLGSGRFARVLYSYDSNGRPVLVGASAEAARVPGQVNEMDFTGPIVSNRSVSHLTDVQATALMEEARQRLLLLKPAPTSATILTTTPISASAASEQLKTSTRTSNRNLLTSAVATNVPPTTSPIKSSSKVFFDNVSPYINALPTSPKPSTTSDDLSNKSANVIISYDQYVATQAKVANNSTAQDSAVLNTNNDINRLPLSYVGRRHVIAAETNNDEDVVRPINVTSAHRHENLPVIINASSTADEFSHAISSNVLLVNTPPPTTISNNDSSTDYEETIVEPNEHNQQQHADVTARPPQLPQSEQIKSASPPSNSVAQATSAKATTGIISIASVLWLLAN